MVDLIHLAGKHILITQDSTIEIYSPARILDINTIDDMTGNKVNFKLVNHVVVCWIVKSKF